MLLQFSAFLKVGLLQDMLCLFDEQERVFYGIITLGDNVCGHPQITHGGKARYTSPVHCSPQCSLGSELQRHRTKYCPMPCSSAMLSLRFCYGKQA